MKKNKIKSGDIVEIIAGSFFGKKGKVVRFKKANNSVYLEEIFREKFFKDNKTSYSKENSGSSSESQISNKKKVLIPIDISNIKKVYNSDGE